MGRIHVLDSALADQIAAGEVVERPASVVKELVENALDAGASKLELRIDGDGVERIEVRDDGHGMSREDAVLAVRRHATSKLARFEDLARLSTLGFRGEALPSIASVCKLELRTRTRESDAGTLVSVEAGQERAVQPIGCPVGTTVIVRDLFFNVPARRKFLKSKSTENAQVAQVLRRVGLARPDLRVRLERDGRTALELLPTDDVGARLDEVFRGQRFTKVEEQRAPIGVRAWLGRAQDAKSGARRLYLFVNGRPVQDGKLARAVARAFGDRLPAGKYPSGAVFLQLPPARVDVNVHPQKAEVRLADEESTLATLTSLLATGLFREQVTKPKPAPGRALPRRPGFWDERLGLGKLEDGQKVGTATAVRQGRSSRAPAPEPKFERTTTEPARTSQPTLAATPSRSTPTSRPPRGASPAPRPKPRDLPRAAAAPSPAPSVAEASAAYVSEQPAQVDEPPALSTRIAAALEGVDPGQQERVVSAVTRVVHSELDAAIEALTEQAEALYEDGHRDAATSLRRAAAALRERLRGG